MQEKFEIKLEVFEGPFDLLLFFIKRDELDIKDIPISKITDDFLDYLHRLQKLDMEVAGEFILVAATLIRIKAKMLLPSLDKENGEAAEIDPREELIRQLLEYKRYKDTLETFERWEEEMLQKHKRAAALAESGQIAEETLGLEADLQDVSLFKLFEIFQAVLKKQSQRVAPAEHQVRPYPYTVEAQKMHLLTWLELENSPISFERIISDGKNKIAMIFNFLAILELIQLNLVTLNLYEGFNRFEVRLLSVEEQIENSMA
jgi:segregation and condensation protein A